MLRALQFSFPSCFMQVGHSVLPQFLPLARFLSKKFVSMSPPASWYFTLNPVISAILSSSSFRLFINRLPLVLGTNITVAASFSFPSFWNTFLFLHLLSILPPGPALTPPLQDFSLSLPLYQVDFFMAFSLSLSLLLHPAFGNIGWYPGSDLSRLLLLILSLNDFTPFSTASLMNSSLWPLVFILVQAFSIISILLVLHSLRLVFLRRLAISSDNVDIFTSLLSAESASTIRFVAIIFSKNS